MEGEISHEEEAVFGRADRCGIEAAELGLPVADLVHQSSISEQKFYRWKKHYAGVESTQVRELKQLSEENARLKKRVADSSLDKAVLQDAPSKTFQASAHETSCRLCGCASRLQAWSCALTRQHRSPQRKPSVRDPPLEIRRRMHEIVQTRFRYGYRRVRVMLTLGGRALGKNSFTGSIAKKAFFCTATSRAAEKWLFIERRDVNPGDRTKPGASTSFTISSAMAKIPSADRGRRVQSRKSCHRDWPAPSRRTCGGSSESPRSAARRSKICFYRQWRGVYCPSR